MIIYQATKREFLHHALRDDIEDVVSRHDVHAMGYRVGQLADRVEHVAATKGDGLGYDVLSFETDGRERFIEVKTTAHDAVTPFFVSVNEVEFARERADQFRLCRLYHFRTAPKFFELSGAIEQIWIHRRSRPAFRSSR